MFSPHRIKLPFKMSPETFLGIKPCLKCGRKPAGASVSEFKNFRLASNVATKMGRPN